MVDETKFFSRMFYSYSFEGPATRATTSSSFGICTVNVCANGGTCQTVPGGGFRCICPSGFLGFYCTVIFPCLSLSRSVSFSSHTDSDIWLILICTSHDKIEQNSLIIIFSFRCMIQRKYILLN